jgi:PPOX class probable F420-dependent enzyme
LLRESRVARIATLNKNGAIHIVPIVFASDSRNIYFAIDKKPKKTKNLRRLSNIRRNPNVSVLIDSFSEDWSRLSFVLIYTRAKILSSTSKDNNEINRVLRLLKQKYSQYSTGGFLPPRSQAITVVRLTPGKIVQWSAKSA